MYVHTCMYMYIYMYGCTCVNVCLHMCILFYILSIDCVCFTDFDISTADGDLIILVYISRTGQMTLLGGLCPRGHLSPSSLSLWKVPKRKPYWLGRRPG